uniref:Uncharacterized protein n=1 Tax=Candidatus Kentrum sp. FM TaxID=2126340 RepID=A0A450TCA0_9GAMM|nr:MAG: hypothetical protein BECKFM1743A_GA0114220_100575 [Candidatus Kentron sp. FM]VFJ64523.1 MAG: hypothetical protein BECKFM1743C_GA0114222_103713 [Candidatus Kentron sp. FM]VFK15228.1 MAG: hypothetical protein BECKFM1743B_GA0114221_103613 [Candidatus Kentron sp. FM]
MNFPIQPKDTPLRHAPALFLFFLFLTPFFPTLRIVARLAGHDRTGVVSRSCSPASVTGPNLAMVGNLPTRAKKPHPSACPRLEIAASKQLVSLLSKSLTQEIFDRTPKNFCPSGGRDSAEPHMGYRIRGYLIESFPARPESRAPNGHDGHDGLFGSDLLSVVAGKSGAARVIAMDSNHRALTKAVQYYRFIWL